MNAPVSYALPRTVPAVGSLVVVCRILTLALSLLVLVLGDVGAASSRETLILYTALLLAYLSVEVRNVARTQPVRWLAHPTVLASLMTFGMGFGFTNVIYLNDLFTNSIYPIFETRQEAFRWMNTAMGYVLAAAVLMWTGSDSGVARRITGRLDRSLLLARWLRPTFDVRWGLVWVAVGLSIAARLVKISLGLFGYSGSRSRIYELAAIREYLNVFESLGLLALVLVSIRAFSRERIRPLDTLLLLLLIALEVGFGAMSGFKGATTLPVVIAAFSFYLCRGRVSWVGAGLVMLALFMAYQVVEPFRKLASSEGAISNTDVGSIAGAVESVVRGTDDTGLDLTAEDTFYRIMERQNFLVFSARAIKLSHDGVPESAGGIPTPKFAKTLVLSPVYAVVPRLLWRDKPIQEMGLWFNYALGFGYENAVGMGSIGYLYLAGGLFAICAVFFLIGIVQSVLFEAFFKRGGGGLLVFLGLVMALAMIKPFVPGLVVRVVRLVPALIALQVLLLRPPAAARAAPRTG